MDFIEYNRAVLKHYLNIESGDKNKNIEKLQSEIKRNKERISVARKKVLDGVGMTIIHLKPHASMRPFR